MGFSYFQHTAADIGETLKRIGVDGLAAVPTTTMLRLSYRR